MWFDLKQNFSSDFFAFGYKQQKNPTFSAISSWIFTLTFFFLPSETNIWKGNYVKVDASLMQEVRASLRTSPSLSGFVFRG